MPFLPCILCGEKLDQRTDKNGKFYFVCDPCGTQFFIRRTQGKEKLKELFRELEKHGLAALNSARKLYTKYEQFFPKSTASRPKSKN